MLCSHGMMRECSLMITCVCVCYSVAQGLAEVQPCQVPIEVGEAHVEGPVQAELGPQCVDSLLRRVFIDHQLHGIAQYVNGEEEQPHQSGHNKYGMAEPANHVVTHFVPRQNSFLVEPELPIKLWLVKDIKANFLYRQLP